MPAQAEVGTVYYVGEQPAGTPWVAFQRPSGEIVASPWPNWASELAKTAFTHDKRLWIAFQTDPYGNVIEGAILWPA